MLHDAYLNGRFQACYRVRLTAKHLRQIRGSNRVNERYASTGLGKIPDNVACLAMNTSAGIGENGILAIKTIRLRYFGGSIKCQHTGGQVQAADLQFSSIRGHMLQPRWSAHAQIHAIPGRRAGMI